MMANDCMGTNGHSLMRRGGAVLVFCVLCSLGLGCATPQKQHVKTQFSGADPVAVSMDDNRLGGGVSTYRVWLDAICEQRNPGVSVCWLKVFVWSAEPYDLSYIRHGESLVIEADGQRMAFTPVAPGVRREKVFGKEAMIYGVSFKQLEKIAAANQVTVRIDLDDKVLEREFTLENSMRFRHFVDRCESAGLMPAGR